jgi:hypothetical protein
MELKLGLQVATPEVDLEGVDPRLISYAEHLGMVHRLLFGVDLTITSGKEGKHVANSFHAIGRAIDVRVNDKDPSEQLVFMTLLAFSAPPQGIAVFDERSTHDEKHVHLELHGA